MVGTGTRHAKEQENRKQFANHVELSRESAGEWYQTVGAECRACNGGGLSTPARTGENSLGKL
jgi:hypothetical protein